MKEYKRHEKIKYNSRGCLTLTKEVANEIKQVYSGQEEGDEDRLVKLQQYKLQTYQANRR